MGRRNKNKNNQGAKGGSRPKPGIGFRGLTTVREGFPDRFKTKQVFGYYQILAPAAGNRASYSFRGNSVYDPDFTGAGSTAFTYTQLSALYNRYRVISSKITIEAFNQGTVPLIIVLGASISNSLPSTDRTLGLRHMAQSTIVPGGPANWKHTAAAGTAAVFGVPLSQVMSEDDFAGLIGGNPNNVWYWHLQAQNLNGATAGSVLITVRLEYEAIWSMPLDLAP
jgi:hypothetical protein